MSKAKKNVLDAVLLTAIVLWLLSWYFESPPYTALHDQLVRRWQFHFPILQGVLPALALMIWLVFSRVKFIKVLDTQRSYTELVSALQWRLLAFSSLFMISAFLGAIFLSFAQNWPNRNDELIQLTASEAPQESIWARRVQLAGQAASKNMAVKKDRSQVSWTQIQRYVPIVNRDKGVQRNGKQPQIYYSAALSSSESLSTKSRPVIKTGYVSWRLLPYSARKAYAQNGLQVPLLSYVITSDFVDLAPYLKGVALFFFCLSGLCMIRLLLTKRIHRARLQEAWDFERGYSKTKNVEHDIFPWSKTKK